MISLCPCLTGTLGSWAPLQLLVLTSGPGCVQLYLGKRVEAADRTAPQHTRHSSQLSAWEKRRLQRKEPSLLTRLPLRAQCKRGRTRGICRLLVSLGAPSQREAGTGKCPPKEHTSAVCSDQPSLKAAAFHGCGSSV